MVEDEFLADDMLVEFHIAIGDARHHFVRHLGHLLSVLALETIIH